MDVALAIFLGKEKFVPMPDSKESPSAVKTDKREVSLGWWYLIALIVLVLDQLTKTWVIAEFYLGQREIITSFFNLVHVHNYGAAFSFLSDAGGWQRWFFAALSAVVSTFIVVWISRLPKTRLIEGLALALILGGALGNLYDRLVLGYVVDFLDFHWSGSHFPAFNVADSGITMGAVLLILDMFITDQDTQR